MGLVQKPLEMSNLKCREFLALKSIAGVIIGVCGVIAVRWSDNDANTNDLNQILMKFVGWVCHDGCPLKTT